MAVHAYERFRNEVKPALKSKVEELSLLGYGTIQEQQLWDFLINKKWKRVKEDIKLFEIVEEVMSLKAGEFMNYASVEALKLSEFSFDNEEDLKELLK
ncbi:post-transcriptional regulator [Robertmurraya yapensis]|uniref:Post-transcriptional regulator n=2 Tax=Bacillaceae TaxID=186817 RepID=A0A431WJ45_9BACI|nr:post-transcriptional regulator [Bacillus yapensis]RTR35434.1 post-transcriptional regulator [Bacillus yapensis]TKS97943.1 post-transcriptional regulator [Bacillus yapensis]